MGASGHQHAGWSLGRLHYGDLLLDERGSAADHLWAVRARPIGNERPAWRICLLARRRAVVRRGLWMAGVPRHPAVHARRARLPDLRDGGDFCLGVDRSGHSSASWRVRWDSVPAVEFAVRRLRHLSRTGLRPADFLRLRRDQHGCRGIAHTADPDSPRDDAGAGCLRRLRGLPRLGIHIFPAARHHRRIRPRRKTSGGADSWWL